MVRSFFCAHKKIFVCFTIKQSPTTLIKCEAEM